MKTREEAKSVLRLPAVSSKNVVIVWVKCGFPSSSGSDERQAQGVRFKLSQFGFISEHFGYNRVVRNVL